MPTDQPGPVIAEAEQAPPPVSPIENELPTYRAISNLAVVSLLCGILSSFSFASLNFLAFSVLAVVLGALANRAIQRNPDLLTGTKLANAGIAMGLIFGLIVVTYTTIEGFVISRAAKQFAAVYAKSVKEGSLGDTLLLTEPPDQRSEHSAADKEMEITSLKQRERMMFEQKMAPVINLRKAVAPKEAEIHIMDVERYGVDEGIPGALIYFAAVLLEIEHGAHLKGEPTNERRFAMILLKGARRGRRFDWWVDDTRFPYEPKSYVVQSKPPDDGHGHAH